MTAADVLRYTAFSTDPEGGNPAGVVLDAGRLDAARMQRIAAEVDFAETAFVTGRTASGAFSVRYFSPIAEVPFCGHATVAAAVAMTESGHVGESGTIRFDTPAGAVSIDVEPDSEGLRASFTSIQPEVSDLHPTDLAAILREIGRGEPDLDPALPPRLSHAGNPHPIVAIADGTVFDAFTFDPKSVRALMDDRGWPATITIVHRRAPAVFAARNLFPVGRITEDPATGSAAAALGAYLRDEGAVAPPARVRIEQGEHVGRPSVLTVDIPPHGGIVVSGHAVRIG